MAGNVVEMFSYAYQGCIYLIKKYRKTVML